MNWLLTRAVRYGYTRAREASTWRNLILLAGGTWTATHPQQAELLVPLCLGLAGFVGSFFPDLLGAAPRADLPPIELQGRAAGAGPEPAGVRVQPVRPHCNTVEATDHDGADFPGWGS